MEAPNIYGSIRAKLPWSGSLNLSAPRGHGPLSLLRPLVLRSPFPPAATPLLLLWKEDDRDQCVFCAQHCGDFFRCVCDSLFLGMGLGENIDI